MTSLDATPDRPLTPTLSPGGGEGATGCRLAPTGGEAGRADEARAGEGARSPDTERLAVDPNTRKSFGGSLEFGGVMAVPLIVGLVELAKRLGLSARYAALLALGLGIAVSSGAWLAAWLGGRDLFEAVLSGLALGLSASGLYSVTRSARALGTE